MPRNSGGTYSLPSGNPVVTGTAISSTWANATLNDLKAEMTDSLSRSNKGGMSAQFQAFAGTPSIPGLSFVDDPDTGLYWVGANSIRMAVGGARLMEFKANIAQVSGTAPSFQLFESDATVDNGYWNVLAAGEDFKLQALTDALVATDFMTVTRTAGVVDSITLNATTITLNGYSPSAAVSTSGTNTWTGANTWSNASTFNAAVTIADVLTFFSTAPYAYFTETDASANNKTWRIGANGEQFVLQTLNDAFNVSANVFTVDRTGTVVDLVAFPGTAVTMAGTLGVTGALTAGSFSGNGASISALSASNLSSGTVPDARLAATIAKYADSTANFTGTLQYGGLEVGFRGVPQNAQTDNYTCVLADAGKHIYHAAGAGAGDTYTIPANASVAYAIGTVITFVNLSTDAVTIAITSDTMYLGGSGSTGSRTLGSYGLATAIKVTSTAWLITGTDLT